MKKLSLILFLMCAMTSVKAQTFNEFFRQKKMQKKYLRQQIVALQLAIVFGQKGYLIAKNGLGGIGDFKAEEYGLHRTYFNSLKNVNPRFRKNTKITQIIALQAGTVKQLKQTLREMQQSAAFSSEEEGYLKRVFSSFLEKGEALVDELLVVTKDGDLAMKDHERLERIDRLYGEMTERAAFSQAFSNEIKMLAGLRRKEARDVQIGRGLHNLKKDGP